VQNAEACVPAGKDATTSWLREVRHEAARVCDPWIDKSDRANPRPQITDSHKVYYGIYYGDVSLSIPSPLGLGFGPSSPENQGPSLPASGKIAEIDLTALGRELLEVLDLRILKEMLISEESAGVVEKGPIRER
jgi:hypothetical protein